MDIIEKGIDNMSLNVQTIIPTPLNIRIFNDYDVYMRKTDEDKEILLGIPNIYCNKYFDDEDFIYYKLNLSGKEHLDLNIIQLTQSHIIDYSIIDTTSEKCLTYLYCKIAYIYQFVNSYYSTGTSYYSTGTSYYSTGTINNNIPVDFLIWVENILYILRDIVDNDKLQQNTKSIIMMDKIIDEYYNELLYGLNIAINHTKMIINHYKYRGGIWYMTPEHLEKFMRILNNISIIYIYIYNTFILDKYEQSNLLVTS